MKQNVDVDYCGALARQGWIVLEDHFPPDLILSLEREVQTIQQKMVAAGIGRGQDFRIQSDVRNDKTLWLDGASDAQAEYLRLMDSLRVQMNQSLYLGLQSYESHFALYEAGGFYKRHLDALKGQRNRIVSAVTYLTSGWEDKDEGWLTLYDMDGRELRRVLPQAGTLALFMSEEIPHEVLPPRRARCSIAGWFRCNPS